MRTHRGRCVALGSVGETELVSDSQRSQAAVAPATGDWVLYSTDTDGSAVIDTVLDRRTSIVRRDPASRVVKQTLAANLDVAAVLHGLDRELNLAQVERFCVLAADSGAEILLVMSKADLLQARPERESVRRSLEESVPGVGIVETSSVMGKGLDQVRQAAAGNKTMVLLGPSGVGKSTLANALLGAQALAVGAQGAGATHTTVTRELVLLPEDGVLIDSPGLRAIGLWEADAALDEVFGDIAALGADCRFRDCTHRSEPDCAVVAAVHEGAVDFERLVRYQRLWSEIAEQSEAHAERVRMQSRGRRGRKPRRRVRRR